MANGKDTIELERSTISAGLRGRRRGAYLVVELLVAGKGREGDLSELSSPVVGGFD